MIESGIERMRVSERETKTERERNWRLEIMRNDQIKNNFWLWCTVNKPRFEYLKTSKTSF